MAALAWRWHDYSISISKSKTRKRFRRYRGFSMEKTPRATPSSLRRLLNLALRKILPAVERGSRQMRGMVQARVEMQWSQHLGQLKPKAVWKPHWRVGGPAGGPGGRRGAGGPRGGAGTGAGGQ